MSSTTHTQHNGQIVPNVRDIGRGPSYIEQQREQHSIRKKKGPMAWHLRSPQKTGNAKLAIKNHFVAMVGEFVGTCLFMIFALGGTNVANIPATSLTGDTVEGQDGTAAAAVNTSSLLYISLSFGFSLAVNAWIFFRVSGGLFNPAVSFGMALVGALTPLRAVLLTISQILGGIVGAAIIQAILPGTLNVRTTLSADTSVVRGLFIEMFLTSMLMITIFLLAAEKHKATFLAPIGIGLSLFIAEMTGVYYTGGSLNPARSFGPAVVLKTFSHYHWIYWLGPFMGAALAAGFYKFIKYLEYETVLGPEADDEKPVLPTSASGPRIPQGPNGPEPAVQENGKAGGYAVMGAGIGDLLTHGSSKAVFDLPGAAGAYDERLDRIESMLSQLISQRPNPNVGGRNISTHQTGRESMATFVGEHDVHNHSKQKSIGVGEDVNDGEGAWALNDMNRLGGGSGHGHGHGTGGTGMTTLPGARDGYALGPSATGGRGDAGHVV